MSSRIGDWVVVELIDFAEPKGGYQHIYQHKDGRRAAVGPGGFCSDPELDQLLKNEKRIAKRDFYFDVALSILLNLPWAWIFFQAIAKFGIKGLFAIAGYGLCSICAFGFWNSFGYFSRPRDLKSGVILLAFVMPLFAVGSCLLWLGQLTVVQVFGFQVQLIWLALVVGFLGSLKLRLRERGNPLRALFR